MDSDLRALMLGTLLSILILGISFWCYRGAQVFVGQLSDFVPTPYETAAGRQKLARALDIGRKVRWELSDGSEQTGFYLPSQNGALIVFAHGSPGNGLGALPEGLVLAEQGYGVLLIDLPGYGASEGDRTWDERYVESVQRALDFATSLPDVDPMRIGGFGYSNGGCVIARAAAEDDRLSAIVLLATYSSLSEQLHSSFERHRTPLMSYFAIAAWHWSGVPVDDLDTVSALRRMSPRPTLIISGAQDGANAVETTERLKQAVPGAETIVFEQMGHLDFAGKLGRAYYDPLVRFWNAKLSTKPVAPNRSAVKGTHPETRRKLVENRG